MGDTTTQRHDGTTSSEPVPQTDKRGTPPRAGEQKVKVGFVPQNRFFWHIAVLV
jgi:hypothetical protein